MSTSKPIYELAKDIGIDNNKVLIACKTLGIMAKGSAKRLNPNDQEKIKKYFESGFNVSEETIDIKIKEENKNKKLPLKKIVKKVNYFPNRLIG